MKEKMLTIVFVAVDQWWSTSDGTRSRGKCLVATENCQAQHVEDRGDGT